MNSATKSRPALGQSPGAMDSSFAAAGTTAPVTPTTAAAVTPSTPAATSFPVTSDNIRVSARFRPPNESEQRDDPRRGARFFGTSTVEMCSSSDEELAHSFTFPRIYGCNSAQEEVYVEVGAPVVTDVLRGYNGTIFVYGQTGSGKTYTMLGRENTPFLAPSTPGDTSFSSNNGNNSSAAGPTPPRQHQQQRQPGTPVGSWVSSGLALSSDAGIIPRAVCDLFSRIENERGEVEFEILVYYVEIYREHIRDLLDSAKNNLQLREDIASASFYVEHCTKRYVASPEEILALVAEGNSRRATAATRANEHSSRSHSVLNIQVKRTDPAKGAQTIGKLFLVDLAGSEKVAKTRAEGERLEEAKQINRSLATLGLVIKELSEGQRQHISYRSSCLTKLLQDSLGGNSKTTLIVCCSPSASNADETLTTLRFGARAANIKNRAVVNAEITLEELKLLLEKAEKEIERLRTSGGGAGGGGGGGGREGNHVAGGENTKADAMRLLALEARLEREQQRHDADAGSLQATIDELRAQQQEQAARDAETAALVESLSLECASWEHHYGRLRAELVSARRGLAEERESRAADVAEMAVVASSIETTQNEIAKLREGWRDATDALRRHADTAIAAAAQRVDEEVSQAASRRERVLQDSLLECEAMMRDLQNDNGGLMLELHLAERKLEIRNSRIENLKVGLRHEKAAVKELQDELDAERARGAQEVADAQTTAAYWRQAYETLRQVVATSGVAVSGSSSGSRVVRVIRPSHSPSPGNSGSREGPRPGGGDDIAAVATAVWVEPESGTPDGAFGEPSFEGGALRDSPEDDDDVRRELLEAADLGPVASF